MPRRPFTARAGVLAAALGVGCIGALPALAAGQAPTEIGGMSLGLSLDQARARAVSLKLPFNGCDTVVAAKSDGRPLVTLCSHQGLNKGTDLDLAKTDLQVWADGDGRVFAIRTSTPISCRPEEQVGVVREIQARYDGFAQWQPNWTWSGDDGTTALYVDMKNAEAPCAVVTEVRTMATHGAVAEALHAEFQE